MADLNLAALRVDYTHGSLDLADSPADPFTLFRSWFAEALQAQLPEPNAMTLATASLTGRPSARIVLLKELDERGFVFFTNYHSRKGMELQQNPYAALVFLWHGLQRQVRVEGQVSAVDPAESAAYFAQRPRGSQLGAWASPQSKEIPSREWLETRTAELEQQYASAPSLPLPPHWGGYVLRPEMVEFWQGRSSRLHDRIRYDLNPAGAAAGLWQKTRLAP